MINLEVGNSRILVDSSLPGNESPPWSEERPTPALSTFQIIYLSKDSQSPGPREGCNVDWCWQKPDSADLIWKVDK